MWVVCVSLLSLSLFSFSRLKAIGFFDDSGFFSEIVKEKDTTTYMAQKKSKSPIEWRKTDRETSHGFLLSKKKLRRDWGKGLERSKKKKWGQVVSKKSMKEMKLGKKILKKHASAQSLYIAMRELGAGGRVAGGVVFFVDDFQRTKNGI